MMMIIVYDFIKLDKKQGSFLFFYQCINYLLFKTKKKIFQYFNPPLCKKFLVESKLNRNKNRRKLCLLVCKNNFLKIKKIYLNNNNSVILFSFFFWFC